MDKEIVLTSIALLFSILLFEYSSLDILVQDAFYNNDLDQWILDRNNQLIKLIFYDGIKQMFYVFVFLILISLIFFRNTQIIQTYKAGLVILCLSAFMVPLMVSGLKGITNVPCPKNIVRYGGNHPYVTVLKKYPQGFQQEKKMRCYPAGHASGGFALLSILFLFKERKNRIIAFLSVMTIGWSIGTYKMLIGDHFLSHTVVTMGLAWLIILIIASDVQNYFNYKYS